MCQTAERQLTATNSAPTDLLKKTNPREKIPLFNPKIHFSVQFGEFFV